MTSLTQSREPFRVGERNHVEMPLLDQLADLDWEVYECLTREHSVSHQDVGGHSPRCPRTMVMAQESILRVLTHT